MRRNRPDVNAAASRPKCRQPIKPYPGQKVLTNHSVQPSVEEIVLKGICIHVLWQSRALANRVLLEEPAAQTLRRSTLQYFRVPANTEHSLGTL